ncbi:MAG: glycosyltransferase [Thermoanaerobaculia bacterium]|nr:glycosyltransferase [Thermoanaerobaculia bacterium]
MKLAVVGPVYPYRAGIAYCTTRLAEELAKSHDVAIHSFSRQFPRLFYPGGDDRDPTLEPKTPRGARFAIDVVNPFTWIREGLRLRRERPDAVIFTWWVWVWAMPYLVMRALLPATTRVVYQCHNITDKEPSSWKSWLTTRALASADLLVIHAKSEADEARRRLGDRATPRIEEIFLPVHEMGNEVPPREAARRALGIDGSRPVALFFGHVRPFKALDVVLDAWPLLVSDVLLLVAGEAWYGGEEGYREQAKRLGLDPRRVRFDFRFIPDSEIATWFAAADVVLAPYRHEAQSGVVLTSFHFGRPVIATRVGGMPEIVENGANGLLIETESPAALAAGLERFFSSCDRGAMERAAAAAARRYSWHEFAARLMQALHS